ncbi:YlbF family regulator [Sporosarcina cascadiensis]|uniref:YlbF family regulator n=1 Tax=Sporosarcina cascadiensis TaxID=2660747 RepID=UPI00129A0F0C|nr:YlbF family regulator [Sporosarcina cascadiensis]
MTVNIYDDMNKLESTLRKTDQYVEVKAAMEDVKSDEEARVLFESFREIQMNLQQKQMAGEEIAGEELEHAQKTAQLAQENPKIMAMLTAEMKLSELIEEVNRVVLKPVQDLYESFN